MYEVAAFLYPELLSYYTWKIEEINLIRRTLTHRLGLHCWRLCSLEGSFSKTDRKLLDLCVRSPNKKIKVIYCRRWTEDTVTVNATLELVSSLAGL